MILFIDLLVSKLLRWQGATNYKFNSITNIIAVIIVDYNLMWKILNITDHLAVLH